MTKEDVKKRLECVARITGNDLLVDAYKIIIEQEKSLQEAQDSILSLAQQNQEYREQQVKQAKIDVLNNVKDILANQKHECLERNNSSGYDAISECEKYVGLLFKEVENETR